MKRGTDTIVGGWETKSSDVIYDNAWIRLEHHQVVTPTGTDGIYGLVRFKHHAVGIVPIDENGNTWLVRQSRYALNQFTWEIPEGGAAIPENATRQETEASYLESAQRELQEETGLIAKNWQELMRLHPSNSVTDQSATIYLATELEAGKQALDETEDIVIKKLPIEDAIAMTLNGEITDAMSVAALLRVGLELKNKD